MKDKNGITNFSNAEEDFSANEYTVTRNEGGKTFADFVDKVMQQIPMRASAKNKNRNFPIREPNDPLAVLRSRGLVSIEGGRPAESHPPASEVDLTLYTEESRIGDVVKVFSSTHRFKNGRLVHSTTQEASPRLDEEMERFDRWWTSQEPGRLKEKESSLQYKNTRRKLCDILKDIQRQEIIRRYGMARKRNSTSYKSLPSGETHYFRKDVASKEEMPNFSEEEVVLGEKEAQVVCLPWSEKMIPRNISSNHNAMNEAEKTRSFQSESSDGKVTYRASWLHRSPRKDSSFIQTSPLKDSSWSHASPRKGQRKDSSCLQTSPLKDSSWSHASPRKGQRKDSSCLQTSTLKDSSWSQASPRKGHRKDSSGFRHSLRNNGELNHKQLGFDLSQNSFRHKVAPVIMASKLQRSMSRSRRSPIRSRPARIRKARSSSEGGKGFKSNKPSMDCGDCLQMSIKHHIDDKSSRRHDPCEYKTFGTEYSQDNSSDTSLCTIFYEANGDWINEEQDSCIYQNNQEKELCHCKNHNKMVEPSPNLSHKRLTRDCRHSPKCCADDPLEEGIKCFAKCHAKHEDEHQVSIMTGIVSSYSSGTVLPDEGSEAMKAIESFINERALETFGKRCGTHRSNCKAPSTAASQQFHKEISGCRQRRRKRN